MPTTCQYELLKVIIIFSSFIIDAHFYINQNHGASIIIIDI